MNKINYFIRLKDEGDTTEKYLNLNFPHLIEKLGEKKEDEIVVQTQILIFFHTYSRPQISLT